MLDPLQVMFDVHSDPLLYSHPFAKGLYIRLVRSEDGGGARFIEKIQKKTCFVSFILIFTSNITQTSNIYILQGKLLHLIVH